MVTFSSWNNPMAKNIAQLMVDTLVHAGVERVYGLPGDSLNGFTDSIRKQKKLRWIHVRHESTAAFAAEEKLVEILKREGLLK